MYTEATSLDTDKQAAHAFFNNTNPVRCYIHSMGCPSPPLEQEVVPEDADDRFWTRERIWSTRDRQKPAFRTTEQVFVPL
jgi:hypothetical protein